MKTLITNLLKGLLVMILFTGTSVVLFTSDVKTVSEAQANVTEAQVIEYLEECGFHVLSCAPKPNTISDWTAEVVSSSERGVTTVTVFVSGNNIIGHQESNF